MGYFRAPRWKYKPILDGDHDCELCEPPGPELPVPSPGFEELVICDHRQGGALSMREGWFLVMVKELYPYWCYRVCGPGFLGGENPFPFAMPCCHICAGSPFTDVHFSFPFVEDALSEYAKRLAWMIETAATEPIDVEAMQRQQEIRTIIAGVKA